LLAGNRLRSTIDSYDLACDVPKNEARKLHAHEAMRERSNTPIKDSAAVSGSTQFCAKMVHAAWRQGHFGFVFFGCDVLDLLDQEGMTCR